MQVHMQQIFTLRNRFKSQPYHSYGLVLTGLTTDRYMDKTILQGLVQYQAHHLICLALGTNLMICLHLCWTLVLDLLARSQPTFNLEAALGREKTESKSISACTAIYKALDIDWTNNKRQLKVLSGNKGQSTSLNECCEGPKGREGQNECQTHMVIKQSNM